MEARSLSSRLCGIGVFPAKGSGCLLVERERFLNHILRLPGRWGSVGVWLSDRMRFGRSGRLWSPNRRTANKLRRPSAGSAATQTYPGGRVVSYGVDAVGRVASVSGVKSGTPTSYVSAISYAAHGGMSSLAFGNTQTETRSWNHRLQMVGVQRGTAFGLSYKYCSDDSDVCTTNNGNVMKQTISHAGNAAQVYTYDAVGRLASAVEGANWNRYYGADRWGNQWVTTGSPSPDAFTPGSAANFEPDNRLHLQSAAYDGAGNQTQIGGYASTYDGEGRLATSTLNSVRTTQSYDGEGRRVKKATGTRTTLFSYGVNGELLEDYDTQLPSVSSTEYLAQDPLGSTRATFTTAGTAVKCSDYMPFGEELPANTGAGRSGTCWAASAEPKVKFTGKERDSETGLDYFGARYMSSAQGRFTTVDPAMESQDPANPQSWNRYAYTYNNPLKYVDHNGKWPTEIHNQIIANAFPGLSDVQLANLKGTSAYVDRVANQTQAGNHDHAMRSPGEDPVAAENAIDGVIASHESAARGFQGGTSPDHAFHIDPGALNEFGAGLHTVMDRTSPAHTGPDGTPLAGSGIPLSKREIQDMQRHLVGESSISPAQMKKAVQAARESFRRTFGDAALVEAIRQQKKKEEEQKQR